MPSPLTKEQKSWIAYDIGNSAFVLVIVTTIMPIFFKDVVASDLPPTESTAYWAYANSFASLILALLAPILGTLGDFQGNKKKILMGLLTAGWIFTALLTQIGPGDWLMALLLYICARLSWAGGNVLYDSFLVDVAEKNQMDRVSALGFAWGYIGSVAPLLMVVGLILTGTDAQSGTLPVSETQWGFLIVSIWWLAFSLPMLRNVKQRYALPQPAHPLRASFRQLASTFRKLRQHRAAFTFLLAYFFYIDGVDTIITMAAVYGRDLDFSPTTLIAVILFIQIVAFPFAFGVSRLADQVDSRRLIMLGILIYAVITFIAFLLPDLPEQTKVITFWIMAFLVAMAMGGIQALSRSYFGKLIPPENSGEFFGLYNVVGRFAAILGPLMIGAIGTMTGHSKWGVLSLLFLFIVGAILLTRVKPEPEPIRSTR